MKQSRTSFVSAAIGNRDSNKDLDSEILRTLPLHGEDPGPELSSWERYLYLNKTAGVGLVRSIGARSPSFAPRSSTRKDLSIRNVVDSSQMYTDLALY